MSSDSDDGDVGSANHALGDRSEEVPTDALPAVGSHDDDVDIVFVGVLNDLFVGDTWFDGRLDRYVELCAKVLNLAKGVVSCFLKIVHRDRILSGDLLDTPAVGHEQPMDHRVTPVGECSGVFDRASRDIAAVRGCQYFVVHALLYQPGGQKDTSDEQSGSVDTNVYALVVSRNDMAEITTADEYDAWFAANEPLFESEVRAIERQLPASWDRAVEIGCGTGAFADRLGIEYGVEPSTPMAERARERGLSVESGSAEDLPLEDDAVDLALLLGVISYVDDFAATLAELARVVEPGGTALVAFLQADQGFAALYDRAVERGGYPSDLDWAEPYPLAMATQATWRTPAEVREGLAAVGFEAFDAVQTLTTPIETAVETVEDPTRGHDEGSWVVLRARRS